MTVWQYDMNSNTGYVTYASIIHSLSSFGQNCKNEATGRKPLNIPLCWWLQWTALANSLLNLALVENYTVPYSSTMPWYDVLPWDKVFGIEYWAVDCFSAQRGTDVTLHWNGMLSGWEAKSISKILSLGTKQQCIYIYSMSETQNSTP